MSRPGGAPRRTDERDEDPDHVAVGPAGEQEQPALARRGRRRLREVGGRLFRLFVSHELDRLHGAQPSDVAAVVSPALDLLEPTLDEVGQFLGPSTPFVGVDLVQHGQGGGARDGVAAECSSEAAWLDRVHDRAGPGHPGEREAATEGLARHEEVRLDPVVLDGPDRAGAAGARLHLVVDVERRPHGTARAAGQGSRQAAE